MAVGSDGIGVAFTPDGAFAYVTDFSSNSVSVIETATNTVATTVAVGTSPVGVAITPPIPNPIAYYPLNGNGTEATNQNANLGPVGTPSYASMSTGLGQGHQSRRRK